MSWTVFWLIPLIVMRSHGCLKCSKDAMAILRDFNNRYLEKKLQRNPDLKTKLQKLTETAVEDLSLHPVHPQVYTGIIDEFSLEKLAAHFKRAVNQIMENEFEGGQLFNEVTWMLQNLVDTFKKLMPTFQKRFCSNECGQMVYMFISCHTCKVDYYTCTKDFRCGERKVQVATDEDLILDCALKWHKASHGVKKYSFYRIVGGKERLMTSGLDAFLVKKEANANDTGKYRCKMLGVEGYIASQLDFQVVVLPGEGQVTWFPRPQTSRDGPLALGVSSRAPPPQADWTVWIVIGSTGGLFLLIIGGFIYFYRRNMKKEEKANEESDDETESEMSELVEM
ncbi:izumo sperm-egg fusion protein 1 isoform X2 [Hemicordylus capensis]|uniref:izumo sperm-egg fusion protein 1 isoform X2 n=1 Tax=Hemicordylus capensis TaxID=884348 RepID=UPI00230268EC|nr:izumo sperm-egg fusion protein 1 isoform X2 [Hemicordylus capensis]